MRLQNLEESEDGHISLTEKGRQAASTLFGLIDRKMFAESEAFLNALLDTVKKDDPDVLLISGDLTKDGEREGHEALAGILERFEEETGAQVYITPGNHDLNNSNARNFNTDSGEAVPAGRTTPEDYKRIYADRSKR